MYVPGSFPPMTYSDGGKNRQAARSTSATATSALIPGRRAAAPNRSRPRATAAAAAATTTSPINNREKEYR